MGLTGIALGKSHACGIFGWELWDLSLARSLGSLGTL